MAKRRNIQDCKFWKPRGRKTHYCTVEPNEPSKQCYGVCKLFVSREEEYKLKNENNMLIAKHTPAKWASGETNDKIEIRSKDNLTLVGHINKLSNEDETQANVRLVVNSPELLEELKKMITAFEPFAKEAQYVSGIFMAKQLVEKVENVKFGEETVGSFYCDQQARGRRDDTCSEQCDNCLLKERNNKKN
jgi:hypothetical protein